MDTWTCSVCGKMTPMGDYHFCGGSKTVPTLAEPSTGAKKFDSAKPDLTLIRYDAIEQVARVFEFGAKKYGRFNYLKGMSHTRLLAACLRHVFAYASGENLDPESGLSHLAHAGCCILMLLTYKTQNLGTDDRGLE